MDQDAGKDNGCDLLLESRKRKRAEGVKSLKWVKKVAKDPCKQLIGSLPEMSKWKYFGYDYPWKHVMLVRQATMVKRSRKSSIDQQSIWQKKQMMHPTMYNCPRYSQRIASDKMPQPAPSFKKPQAQSCSKSTSADTQRYVEKLLAGWWRRKYIHTKIPVGIDHQAEVPEWTETVSDGESKWLGRCIWPQEGGVNHRYLIERDPSGTGRPDHCGCEFKGSIECFRLHISEKRIRLKLELGVAFYDWLFDKMGEEVALSWKKSEELKFEAIVRANPPPQRKRLWEKISKYFHYKRWDQLSAYFFNVFLLRRRAAQNRSSLLDISSDDDGLQFETTTNCSGQTAARSRKRSNC